MNKILQVAAREFNETAKTKTFLIGAVIAPLVMFGVIIFIQVATHRKVTGPRPDRHVAVINRETRLTAELEKTFEDYNRDNPQRRLILHSPAGADQDELKDSVREGDFAALLVIDADVLDGEGGANLYTYISKDLNLPSQLRMLLDRAVSNKRYTERGLSPELIAQLRGRVSYDVFDLAASDGQKANPVASVLAPMFFMMLIYFGITFTGQALISSIIEEKGSRIVEVLLSAVSSFELMAGKIAGLSGVGLIIVAIYGGGGYVAAKKYGVSTMLSPELTVLFIIYFILGFILLSAISAAVGSICNNIRESQNYNFPIMMMTMIPVFAGTIISQDPNGTLAVALSFVPPMTPFVMVLRLAVLPQVPWLQVALSLLVLAISVPAVVWVCARIFRTGLLMYGKPPSPAEIIRWVHQA